MGDSERDQHFERLQLQAKRLGVSVMEMLLTGSELYWAIMLNSPAPIRIENCVWVGKE